MAAYYAYKLEFKPIVLKRLILDLNIRQAEIAKLLLCHRATINIAVNRGVIPTTIPNFKCEIEQYLSERPDVCKWLEEHEYKITDIWEVEGSKMKWKHPARGSRTDTAMIPGDPNNNEFNQEVEVLTGEALRHFKLFRNPFVNDIRDISDIYLSDEHRYIKEVMLDAAKNQGFVAVVGEVGSGKSAIRKYVVEELNRDESMRIIFPRLIDKTRVAAPSLCDAIVMDLSDEHPKGKLEQKSRQVERLLTARLKAGARTVLMIEEAHDLTVRVLKLLKRIYEIEHGYRKATGIILIGQPELGSLFNEGDHYEMREVIRRCQVAYIRGLNGNLKPYLTHKFKKANVDIGKIIDDKALKLISERLTDTDERRRKISNAYPLTVNNMIVRAMNTAYELGEPLINETVVMSL